MSPNGHPDPTGELGKAATKETKQLLGPDHESVPLGCAAGLFFAILAISIACLGFTGSSSTSSAASRNTVAPGQQSLGKLPELDVTKPAAPPTTTTTTAPAPEPEAPAIVVPGPQQGGGQPSAGGGGGGGGGGGAPAPPPPAEVCSLSSGSISTGGNPGSLPGTGGSFTATGPSNLFFSGYSSCHSYTFSVSSSDGASGSGCFQTATGLSVGTTPGATVNITMGTKSGGC